MEKSSRLTGLGSSCCRQQMHHSRTQPRRVLMVPVLRGDGVWVGKGVGVGLGVGIGGGGELHCVGLWLGSVWAECREKGPAGRHLLGPGSP